MGLRFLFSDGSSSFRCETRKAPNSGNRGTITKNINEMVKKVLETLRQTEEKLQRFVDP